MFQTYLNDCRLLLIEFEKTQLQMLRMNIERAAEEFNSEIKQMRFSFEKMKALVKNTSFDSLKDQILLNGQIGRLLSFLKEMEGHVLHMQEGKIENEQKVIFIFDRQHLFKKIYRKHLLDFERLSE
jgi:hypothetical protein